MPKYKELEIAKRHFRVGKFSAREGSYIAFKIAGLMSSLFDQSKTDMAQVDIGKFMGDITGGLSEKEFAYFQEKALAVTEERLPGGWTKVVQADGTFAVFELEDNASLVLMLMLQALIWNVQDFFSEDGLMGMIGQLFPTNPSEPPTSTSSSSPPS